ncbi:MAG: lipoate--protein ligase family protein [Ignavibacteria bacterium]|nr:lipoate--protein ligase family protein [Ignavibacteria bacterium]
MMWNFLNTGFHTGVFNMEFDEMLARQLNDENGLPTLRVYGWKPHAISIGFNQQAEDFDAVRLQQAGIDLVRRPTGGRAIFHAHELTYSVIMHVSETLGPRSIYRFINEGLIGGLHLLGIHAELSAEDDDFRKLYRDASSIPCFTSSAKSEIQFKGRKLVGSAQRRFGSVILQHGSLLLGPQHRKLSDFLAPHLRESREIIDDNLMHRTTDAESILGRAVTFEDAACCIKKGFKQECNITFEDSFTLVTSLIE